MNIQINGKPLTLDGNSISLSDLLVKLTYTGNYFAVAINDNCIPRSQFENTQVKESDSIEILFPQAGG
jgi:sulfur carrier protein